MIIYYSINRAKAGLLYVTYWNNGGYAIFCVVIVFLSTKLQWGNTFSKDMIMHCN